MSDADNNQDMAARITLKTVNGELARRGIQTVLTKGPGYYYFRSGEASDWLDRTVPVAKISALTLEEWIGEFERLQRVNQQIMGAAKPETAVESNRPRARTRRKVGG